MSIYCFNEVINSELKQPEFSLICLLEKTHVVGNKIITNVWFAPWRIPDTWVVPGFVQEDFWREILSLCPWAIHSYALGLILR